MTTEAQALLTVAGDCNFPPVGVGRAVIRGRLDWERAMWGSPPTTPGERRVMFRQLERPFLLSTIGGRTRMRNWIAERRASTTTPPSAAQHREWLHEHLVKGVQHRGVAERLERGLARLPVCVSTVAVRECAFHLNGGCLRGWYGGTAPADRATMNITGGPDVETTVMHESAHAFLGPLPTERSEMISLVGRERVMERARVERWPAVELVAQRAAREERIVRALEQLWSARS